MMKNDLIFKLTEKIENNIEQIGKNLKDFSGREDGKYFIPENNGIPLWHIFNWTQSFFTGMAFWAYRINHNEKLLKWIYSFYEEYYDKVFKTPMETMHDTGFLYTPYAVALYKITGDEKMKELGIKAADELAKRFVLNGSYIQAWGRMDGKTPDYVDEKLAQDVFFQDSKGRMIVDCMMNLPLLFWASEVTGHPYYKNIAEAHAQTTIKYFIREDYSICHAIMFDSDTGEFLKESNSCGYADGSHWARGAAWAIYGFAIAYAYTNKKCYLEISIKLFEKFIDECKGKMPLWDFRLPAFEKQTIDTSAIAVTLCAAIEILKHADNKKIKDFEETFGKMIIDYVDVDLSHNGLLKEQNGTNKYTPYGDYFLIEYLSMKYNKDFERIW